MAKKKGKLSPDHCYMLLCTAKIGAYSQVERHKEADEWRVSLIQHLQRNMKSHGLISAVSRTFPDLSDRVFPLKDVKPSPAQE